MPTLAVPDRHHDGPALDRIERGDHSVNQRRADPRHVTEADHRPRPVGWKCGQPRAQGSAQALGKVGIVGEAHLQPAQGLADFVLLVAEHHQDRIGPRGQGGLDDVTDHGLAGDLEQQLVRAAHAPGLARGQNQGRDLGTCGCRLAFARLRPRGDLAQQATHAHPHDVAPGDRDPGRQALQDPVEAIELGRSAAAGQAEHWASGEPPKEEQVARINRHAEMLDRSAGGSDPRRQHVVAIGDRRGARDQEHVAACGHGRAGGGGHGVGLVSTAGLADEVAADRGDAVAGDPHRLLQHLGGDAGQLGLDQPRAPRPERRHLQQRSPGECAAAVRQQRCRDRERNDLDRGHHLAGIDHGMFGEGGQGHRLVDAVEAVDPLAVDQQQSAFARMQVGPAGEGRRGLDRGARDQRCQFRRRLILAHVGPADAQGHHGFDPRTTQTLHVLRREEAALAEDDVVGLDAVREHGTFGVIESEAVEFHGLSGSALGPGIYSDALEIGECSTAARGKLARMIAAEGEWPDLAQLALMESAAATSQGAKRLIGPLLLASLVVVPVTWWLPLFTARVPFLWRHEVSIASGLVELWRLDLVLFAAVLLFSVIAPLAKGLALAWVWFRLPATRAQAWLGRLALLGKLSMTEVFLLAVIIVGLKGVGIGTVEVSWGLQAFVLAVLLSLAASTWASMALARPQPSIGRATGRP